MCQIIDQSYFGCYVKQTKLYAQRKNQPKSDYKVLLQEIFSNIKYQKCKDNSSWEYNATCILYQICPHLDLFFEILFSGAQFLLKTKSIFNSKLVPVLQRENRKIIAKQISRRSFLNSLQPNKIIFSFDNGSWYIKSPIYSIQNNPRQFKKQFHQIIQELIKKSIFSFQSILKINIQKKQEQPQTKNIKMNQIMRYYLRCTIQPSISIKSDCAEYESLMNKYAASRIGLEDLIQFNKISRSSTQISFQSLKIYGNSHTIDCKVQYLDQITLKQKQRIQDLSRQRENKFVFNHCYFLKEEYPQKKIGQGGNSQIFVIKPEIYEYSSTNNEEQSNFQKSNAISKYISKHLIIKKPILQVDITEIQQNKAQIRQRQIVSRMRGGSCLFLPKYYLNIQKQSVYDNKLFVDYLPGETLDEYIEQNSQTISIFTKMYLLLQILQGLRFVNQYGIVHLDIKQRNIIVIKKLICKIFDFGESYQYNICGVNHKPKYSMIYGSPEAVTSANGRVFTQKSDSFSLGVMMHKILFQRYPYFFLKKQKFQRLNIQERLRQITFYTPEENEQYGDKQIVHILNQIIYKCIEIDETKRPYLDWTTLIMKCCLNYIASQ